jgi:hypothetical protein
MHIHMLHLQSQRKPRASSLNEGDETCLRQSYVLLASVWLNKKISWCGLMQTRFTPPEHVHFFDSFVPHLLLLPITTLELSSWLKKP